MPIITTWISDFSFAIDYTIKQNEIIDLVENEFNLLTTKTDVDANTQQAWLSMWLRDTDMNKGGSADSDIEEFFKDFFFEGVFKNGQLRSH